MQNFMKSTDGLNVSFVEIEWYSHLKFQVIDIELMYTMYWNIRMLVNYVFEYPLECAPAWIANGDRIMFYLFSQIAHG